MTGPAAEPLPGLPGLLGIVLIERSAERVEAVLTIRPAHMAATGYLHAAGVVALADTACGYGCLAALPAGKVGFTTIELKSNHLATAPAGQQLRAVAIPVHRGRMTQVWDAVVTAAMADDEGEGRRIALFRCTQMLLDSDPSTPRQPAAELSFGPNRPIGRRTDRSVLRHQEDLNSGSFRSASSGDRAGSCVVRSGVDAPGHDAHGDDA